MAEFERVADDIHSFFERNPEAEALLREALRGPDVIGTFASLDSRLRTRLSNFRERAMLAHPDIRKGYNAGSRAEKPPVNLEDVIEYQRIFDNPSILYEDGKSNVAGFILQG